MRQSRTVFWVRVVMGTLFLCLIALIAIGSRRYGELTPARLHDQLSSHMGLAFAVMLGFWLIRPLGFAVPMSVMSLAGGYLFGGIGGAVVNCLGINAGALLSFGIAHLLGRDVVEGLFGKRTEKYLQGVREHPIETILLLRLMPVFSFTVVCALSGVMGIRTRHYVAGTAMGSAPAAIVYAICGSFLQKGIGSAFWVVLVFSIGMILLPVLLYYTLPAVRRRINRILLLDATSSREIRLPLRGRG